MLHHPALLKQHVSAIVALVLAHHYAGIDIDYENLHAADRHVFTVFITDLAAALHAHGKMLSVAVFAKTTNAGYGGAQPGPGLRRHRPRRRPGADHGLQLPLGDIPAGAGGADRLGARGAALRQDPDPGQQDRPRASRSTATTGPVAGGER